MIITPRERDLGGFSVRRVLPSPGMAMVGPWIFFDHMGPVLFQPGQGIDVRPHPHINLATVTYLFEGEILHRDSLGNEVVIAHNIASPYRQIVLDAFQKHRVMLNMAIEMPTVETIKKLVESQMGVAFVPRMCVQSEVASGQLVEVPVRELQVARKIHLVYPARRHLPHAAQSFLELVKTAGQ